MANPSAFDVVETTIADVHAGYKAGTLTVRQLVQAYLDRIAAYDKTGPAINAIISVNQHALEEADRLDAKMKDGSFVGSMHGIPIIIKDQADVDGMPTTMGSVLFEGHMPGRDCTVAARLKKAGAIFLGKSTLARWVQAIRTARCSAPRAMSTTCSARRAGRRAARARRFRRTTARSRSDRKASPRSGVRRSGTASSGCGRQPVS